MTGYVTVIGGVNSGNLTGQVSVPSTLSQASVTQTGTFLNTVQNFLNDVSDSVLAGTYNLTNVDTVSSSIYSYTVPAAQGGIYEITNTDSLGNTTAGSVSVDASVSSAYNAVVLEAPGNTTLAGNGASVASTYVLGSQTTAIVSTNGSGTAGGSNTIYGLGGNDTIYAAGDNNATFVGGVDRYKVLDGNSTVVAAGNATVQAGIPNGYTGTIDFINESSAQAVVFGEHGSVTAFGGAGGGLFYGGTGGNNSLLGGSGQATLVGSNEPTGTYTDWLEVGGATGGGAASSAAANNYMFAGSGNETLLATSVTHNNLIALGTGSDFVSTAGSGNQYFFSANSTMASSATIYGATTVNAFATNNYYLGTSLNGVGAVDYIENYNSVNSHLYAVNGDVITSIGETSTSGGTYHQQGALVQLSDGTQVVLVGVNSSNLSGTGSPVLFYN